MKPIIEIFEDKEALANASADSFMHLTSQAIRQRGRFLVALCGGETPLEMYTLLTKPPYKQRVEWLHVHFFWSDERCVPKDDPQGNYYQAHKILLSKVPVRHENVHRIQAELDPEEAAKNYAKLLNSYAGSGDPLPRFDLAILGLGMDGHTASLFPGMTMEASSTVVVVSAEYEHRPNRRITLTPAVLNFSREIIFLVSGARKSAILARVLYGDYHPENLPAQRIQPEDGKLTWMVDKAAANGFLKWRE